MSRPGIDDLELAQRVERQRLARDDDRAVAEAHRRAVREQQVAVGDVRVGAHRDRGHLEPALRRPLVERLDVRDDLLELEPARVDAAGLERPEHERVVRVCAVSDADPHARHATGRYARAVTRAPLSEAIQDYLKGIYKLQAAAGASRSRRVARAQGVSPASASAMVKKLAALELARARAVPRRAADRRRRARRARGDPPPPAARALPRADARPRRRRRPRGGRPARARDLRGARGADRPGARLPDARPARRPDPGRRTWSGRRTVNDRRTGARAARAAPRGGTGAPFRRAVLLGDDAVVLERPVRGVERVVELVPLPDDVVGARLRRRGARGSPPCDHPQRARPPLDPDDDPLGASRVVPSVHDPLGEPPRRRTAFTGRLQSRRGQDVDVLRTPSPSSRRSRRRSSWPST